MGVAVAEPLCIGEDALENERVLGQVRRQRCSVRFDQTPANEVVAALSRDYGIPIKVDLRKSQDPFGEGSDPFGREDDPFEEKTDIESVTEWSDHLGPITYSADEAPFADVLTGLLKQLDLAWVIDQGAVSIIGDEDESANFFPRLYPVADLVQSAYPSTPENDAENLSLLAKTIEANLEVDTWEDVGGPGMIDTIPRPPTLTIYQTETVHQKIEKWLAEQRK